MPGLAARVATSAAIEFDESWNPLDTSNASPITTTAIRMGSAPSATPHSYQDLALRVRQSATPLLAAAMLALTAGCSNAAARPEASPVPVRTVPANGQQVALRCVGGPGAAVPRPAMLPRHR